jgi:hypothetical protein
MRFSIVPQTVVSTLEEISHPLSWNFNEVPSHSPALFSSAKTTLGPVAEIPNPEWVVAVCFLLRHCGVTYNDYLLEWRGTVWESRSRNATFRCNHQPNRQTTKRTPPGFGLRAVLRRFWPTHITRHSRHAHYPTLSCYSDLSLLFRSSLSSFTPVKMGRIGASPVPLGRLAQQTFQARW